MYTAIGYAAQSATAPLAPMTFERRAPRADDVAIEILYCGVCHSDIHQARNEWGIAVYPLMPGHEIVGRVTATGANATKYKVGDLVGVGCMVDSCRECSACKSDLEQYCLEGPTMTYATHLFAAQALRCQGWRQGRYSGHGRSGPHGHQVRQSHGR